MYIFGVDIPLVEVLLAVGIIGLIILIEITIILVMISYHMRNSKKLESQMGRLSSTLLKLESKELKEIDKLEKLEETEKDIIKGLKKLKPESKKGPKLTHQERKKLYNQIVEEKPKNSIIEKVDEFLQRWKR